MKVYKRILAGTIVAGLLLSGISDYAGNLSLISPVSASEISSSEYAFLNKNDAPITDESSVTTRLSEQAESLYKEESSVEADFSANEGTSTQPDTSVNEGSSAQSDLSANEGSSAQSDFSTNEQSSVQEDISVQSESSEQNELTVQEELSGQGAQSAKENEQIVPGHDNSSSVSLPEDTSTAEDAKAALAEEGILLEEILPTGEAEILVGADGLPDGVTSLKETLDTSSIMNINLFDYEAYDGGRLVRAAYTDNRGNYHEAEYSWNSAGIDHSENFDTSNGKETINVDSDGKRRQFRFFPSGTGVGNGTYTINNYSGGHDTLDSAAVQGIVDDNTQNGYPVLKDGYTDNTTTKVNTDMSLAYLFDPVVSDSSVPGRTSYTGLNYLFYIDDEGYYTFDSAKNYAYLDVTNGSTDFALYNLGKDSSNQDLIYPGFFPLTNYNKAWNGKSTSQQHTTKYNHHFGLTMSAEFMIPEGGQIDGKDEVFKFSGDDDVWVFVDGKLVLDLGGIHQPIGGSINFRTGEVIYDYGIGSTANGVKKNCNTVQVGQYDSQKIAPHTEIQTNLKNIIDNSSESTIHTIQFFMCERGGCDSNCLLQFNLLMLESLRVGKKVTGDKTADDMNCDFGFIIYLEDENGEFQAVTSDQVNREDKMLKLRKASDNSEIPFSEDNSSIFYLKDGEEAVLSGIQKGRKYYVEEVGVDTSRYKVFLNDSEDEETVTDGTVTASQATIAQRPKLTFYNEVRPDRNLRVRKEWIGEGQTNENDEHIGTAVTLHLKADGVEIGSVTLDGNTDEVETTAWEHTFEKLPVEATDSHTIQYTVTEDAVDGYYTLYDTADETTSITVDSTKTYWEAADGMEDPSTLPRGSYLVVAESANSDRALYAEYDASTQKDGVAHLSSSLTRLSGVLRDEDGIIHNDYLEIPTDDLDNYIWSVDTTGGGYSLYYPTKGEWLGYSTEYYTYNGQQMVSRNSFSLQNSAPSAPILGSDGYLKGSRTSGGSTVTDYIYNNSGAVEVTQNESSATKFTLYRKIIPAETETTTVVTVSNKRVTTLQENQFYLPISKKIDAFRDGDDNPTTTYEDEMTEDEKKDLYRLYLDIGPIQNEKTNVILVMDYSYTMYPVVDEHNDFAYKIGDKYFDRRYLMTDEGGNYVTRYDAMLDAMTGDNSLVDMILPDGNTKNEMYVIGFSEKDKTESLTDWTTDGSDVKSGLAGKIPEGYRNYEAALQEAEEAINNAPADGKTYLIFVSDGIPTAYIKDEIIYEEVGRTYTINSQEYNGKGEESVQNLSGDVDGDGNIIPDSTNSVISHTESVINSFKQAISDKVESVSAVAFSNLDMAQNITAENKAEWDDIRHDYSRITLDTSYDYLLRNVMGDAFYSATGANELVKAVSETLSIRRIQGPVITDQLTGYVSVDGQNNGDLKMIMKSPDPSDSSKTKESVLWENGATTASNVQSDGTTPIVQNVEVSNTGKIVVTFNSNYVIPDDYTFTVSLNVKATETARDTWIANETASRNEEIAEDERPENGYDGVKGDADTDFSYVDTKGDTHANDTSSDHYGFRSNVSADVVYKVIRDYYREVYKHPVIQVDTTVDITMIKTSSVELPKADSTKGYVILPGVEFTLYEKTVTTETDPDTEEQVEKEVLTPVKTGIVSDDGKADDPNDPDAVAEAAARKGKVFLTDLKRGSTYYLEETKAAEGYFIPAEKWKIVVGIDGTVTISGQDNYAADYTVPESGEFAGCYRISNVKMYELPSTGGPGDYLFTIIGVAICALVVFKRREERAA